MNGKKNWVFCDGDLPPHGDNPEFLGHEALMITNVSKKDAKIRIKILFEDKEPYEILEMIGRKRGMLISGGEINTERAATTILDEYRAGKLGKITLDSIPQE